MKIKVNGIDQSRLVVIPSAAHLISPTLNRPMCSIVH
jgi:hypothetical protein